MNTERPIREFYDLLPEPERSEANAARDRAEARDESYYPKGELANSLPDALWDGFNWEFDGKGHSKWNEVMDRAEAGEFNGPSEVDRLRARVAELEGQLGKLYNAIDSAVELTPELLQETSAILNKK